jgi:tripartite-type tricarboxylate transporter receptor subunit TctC
MKSIRRIFSIVLLLASSAVVAQGFPDRPLRLVIGFAPGGNVDIVNRIVAQGMSDILKQPIVVENRAGANGAIGAEYVARAASDGYTLFVAVAETHALNPSLRKALPYDPVKDFTGIGVVGSFAYALVISPKLPASDVKSFIAHARQSQGRLNFSSWGSGSLSQIAFEQIKQITGVDLVHVPFKGAAPAMQAITGDSVQAFVAPISLAVPYAADGRVKFIAVTSAKRQDAAPNVPTLTEQGIAIDIAGWNALVAPAGTPPDAVATLNRALNAAIARPEVREKLIKLGTMLAPSTPQQTTTMIASELKRWSDVARKAGIQPE